MRTNPQLLVAVPAGLAVLEFVIYFRNAAHFFQGDTIYWFYHRLTSASEFLASFGSPDPGGWYRPLTNRTIQSLLYPFFGLNPQGYRWLSYILFFTATLGVLALSMKLTRKPAGAAIAGLFFAIHTINAYTTYDLSFAPELVYSILYICATLAFLKSLETGGRGWWTLSIVAFALSLCSKEAAATLPVMLFALAWISGHGLKRFGKALIPHGVLLVAYLLFTVVHLGVASEALASLRVRPAQLETGGYYFMLGPHLLTNAGQAWAWALNLPVGMLGQWRVNTQSRSLVLWGFAAIQMLLIPYAFRCGQRKPLLSGLAWFWIASMPALPLMGHFLPYYLFLPIAGFSVIVGATWNCLYEVLPARFRVTAAAGLCAIFGVLILVCARTSRSEARNNFLLGASSAIAENSVRDIQRLHPVLASGTTIFFNNDAQPDLYFHHAQGALFRMVYGDESLQFKYSTLKELPPEGALRLIYKDGHLYDER